MYIELIVALILHVWLESSFSSALPRQRASGAVLAASSRGSTASNGRGPRGSKGEGDGGSRVCRLEVKGFVKDWKNKDDYLLIRDEVTDWLDNLKSSAGQDLLDGMDLQKTVDDLGNRPSYGKIYISTTGDLAAVKATSQALTTLVQNTPLLEINGVVPKIAQNFKKP